MPDANEFFSSDKLSIEERQMLISSTEKRILSTIGLAFRGGKITSGTDTVTQALRADAVEMLILATDGSENANKKLVHMAEENEIAVRFFSTKEGLGHAIGKVDRNAIAIMDEGFAKKLTKEIDDYLAFAE